MLCPLQRYPQSLLPDPLARWDTVPHIPGNMPKEKALRMRIFRFEQGQIGYIASNSTSADLPCNQPSFSATIKYDEIFDQQSTHIIALEKV